jgi:hypothetical protein
VLPTLPRPGSGLQTLPGTGAALPCVPAGGPDPAVFADAVARYRVLEGLRGFRQSLHECLDARADALFEVADAVLCADHAVTSLVQLSLEPEFTRGHGAMHLPPGESTTGGSSPCWQWNFRRPLTARRPATWPGAGPRTASRPMPSRR